jgi:hypothetical protein
MAKNKNGCLFRRFFFVTFFWHGKESKKKKNEQQIGKGAPKPKNKAKQINKSI